MGTRVDPTAVGTPAARKALVAKLFPSGIPRLWCPTLTHFAAKGQLDAPRIGRHLHAIAPYVKGILVPGSTGEGWEMSDADIQDLLAVVLDAARVEGIRVLIGVLKTSVPSVLACIDGTLNWLKTRTGTNDSLEAMLRANVVGFTVCPPKGSDLSQQAIHDALAEVLSLGLPVALYQLPQVTGNEMSPQTLQSLAAAHPNFLLFKDTSGQDRVARSGYDFGGVFLVRGAEGDYAAWPRTAGGPYDGFLLSTANVFARELASILSLLEAERHQEAAAVAGRIEPVVRSCFKLVTGFPSGNPFTNANKLLDHVMAWGPAAARVQPPLLYSGVRLPAQFIPTAIGLLEEAGLLPSEGYLSPV